MNVRTFVRAMSGGMLAALPLLVLACREDPTETGTGEPAALTLSRTSTSQAVASSFNITVRVTDSKGTRLAVPISATPLGAAVRVDSTVSVNELTETRVYLTSLTFDTAGTNVAVTAESLADTLTVMSFPASLAITPPTDTILSGDSLVISVAGIDANGANFGPVPFAITDIGDESIVEATPSGVAVRAKAPGVTIVELTGPGGGLTGTTRVEVEPGPFAGTSSSGSGNSGDIVTYTVGGGQPNWDADTGVQIGGLRGFVLSATTTTDLVTSILWGIPAGPNDVVFTGVGSDQLGLATSFDVAAMAANDDHEPNNVLEGDVATVVTLPYEDINIVDATDLDDFFQITVAVDTDVNLFLDWDDALNGDMDLLVTDLAIANEVCGFVTATGNHPEEGTCTLAAGSYYVWVNNFAEAGPTNYHILVEPQ